MKILQVIDSLYPGGAERMCVNIANALHEVKFDVQVCTTRSGGSLRKELNSEIVYYCIEKKGVTDLKAFRKFIHIVRSEKIDLIHAHSSSLFWAIAAKVFVRKIKVLWHDHLGLNVNERKNSFFYRLLSFKLDGIISVNSNLESWSKQNMHISEDKIVLINNFSCLPIRDRRIGEDIFLIVCLANIRPQKDHVTLIKAIDQVLKKATNQKLKLLLVGQYVEDKYFLNLQRLIAELHLGSIIEFTGPVKEISGLLADANCGLLSSSSEGLPVSLLEYGMAGLPVIITDVGQCAEVTGHGKFGKIVKPGDSEAMAEELLWIIQNRKEAEEMGEAFREHVSKNYGSDNFLSAYYNLLNRIFQND